MQSDDEFGAYGPTTPFKPVAVNSKKPTSRTTKPNSRSGAVAGPSSKPVAAQAGTKRKNRSPEPTDAEAQYGQTEDEEGGRSKVKRANTAGDTGATGKTSLKGKGKAKAEPPAKMSNKTGELMEVDEPVEDTDGYTTEKPVPRPAAPSKKKAVANTSRQTSSSDKELSNLRQKLLDVEGQRNKLSEQLEEILHLRHTVAEESLDHQSIQYEARLNTQEKLIQELTSQLARVEPLAKSGKTSLLHFLTRDAADEEQRGLEDEINHWKDVAKSKSADLAAKDKRIAELERIERDVRYELEEEIKRSKTLAAKGPLRQPPGSGLRGRIPASVLGSDELKNTAVVKFYEDLTNLLVPKVKIEPGKYLGLEETCFTCVYTYMDLAKLQNDEVDPAKGKSLTFTLRFYHDLVIPEHERTPADENVLSMNQLVQSIKYTPLELDKESDEFVEKLKFLGDAFIFGQEQLALFLKTMYDTLSGALQDDDEDEDMDG